MSSFYRTLCVMACLAMMGTPATAMVINPHPLRSFSEILSENNAGRKTPSVVPATRPRFEGTMVFGAASVFLLLVCKIYQRHGRGFVIGTIVFALMAAIYGFLQGAWPLGIAMGAYSIANLRLLRTPRARHRKTPPRAMVQAWQQSRMERLFGPMSTP